MGFSKSYDLRAVLALGITLLIPALLSAQNTPFPVPSGTELGMSIEDVTVERGAVFDIVVHLDNPNPIGDWILAMTSSSPANCQFLVTNVGAGIEAYSAANGTLPPGQCDIFTNPADLFALMFFSPAPYQSSIYGSEVYRITCVAGMTTGEVTLPWLASSAAGQSEGVVVITIADSPTSEEPDLMRGDVNMDTVCNLTDAINLLDYLYVGSFVSPCADACDVDDSGSVNLADAINLLSGLFGTGFILEDTCKADTTPDALTECLGSNCP